MSRIPRTSLNGYRDPIEQERKRHLRRLKSKADRSFALWVGLGMISLGVLIILIALILSITVITK